METLVSPRLEGFFNKTTIPNRLRAINIQTMDDLRHFLHYDSLGNVPKLGVVYKLRILLKVSEYYNSYPKLSRQQREELPKIIHQNQQVFDEFDINYEDFCKHYSLH
jgi:hypothetical protein